MHINEFSNSLNYFLFLQYFLLTVGLTLCFRPASLHQKWNEMKRPTHVEVVHSHLKIKITIDLMGHAITAWHSFNSFYLDYYHSTPESAYFSTSEAVFS